MESMEKLILNTLTFEYPKEPLKFYFSTNDDAGRKSTRLKSPVLVLKEIKQNQVILKNYQSAIY